MSPTSLNAEAVAWFDGETTPASWEEAVELLAPTPVEENNADPQLVVRHAAARFIAGTLGDSIPAIVRQSGLLEPIRSVLRDIGDIEDLPSGWEARHREVQALLNPRLTEVFASGRNKIKPKPYLIDEDRANQALFNIAVDARDKRGDWSQQAKCGDALPETFHVSSGKGRKPRKFDAVQYWRQISSKALSYCNQCPVTEECYEYGLTQYNALAGYQIYGGRLVFGQAMDDKHSAELSINLLDNPHK